ncbi:MAG: LysM peptidoglycan-binding domain-containing protein [Thermoflexales bacterium]|nr:LysM peptidoglycan-binding domain-containing protein [Thermoflexales bacterium]
MSKLWHVVVAAIVIGALAATWPIQAQGQNLLVDGDFESPPPWPMQNGISEVQVAPGWRAWYLDSPPSYIETPANCSDNDRPDCYWMRPEFRDTVAAAAPNRVRSGIRAQKYFSFGRMHEAGLMQTVTGVTPGMSLRFSIFMHAWMCYEMDACGKYGVVSDAPSNMHLRVGIDPYGGTDPFSSNIIWGPEQEAFDRWVEFAVEATAQAYAVTVFTHSRADWGWARQSNDVYLDDASLVQLSGAAAQPTTPAEPAPTAAAQPTDPPPAQPTPPPDGTITHIVQAGDTLFGISLQYNVPLADLYRLNNLSPESFLYLDQELIIKAGEPGSLATPPAVDQATPTPVPPTSTPTPQPGGLCLGAFEDTNGNGLQDGDEPALAGVTFVVVSPGNTELEASYVTDGLLASHCLATLPPGAYSAQVIPPAGYMIAFDTVGVTLAAGQRVDLQMAVRRGEFPSPTPPATVQAQPTPTPSPARSTSGLTIGVIVLGALLLGGSLLAFALRKRSA